MNYIVYWPRRADKPRSPSRLKTKDGEVVEATPAVNWAIGKAIGSVQRDLEQYGATVIPDCPKRPTAEDYRRAKWGE